MFQIVMKDLMSVSCSEPWTTSSVVGWSGENSTLVTGRPLTTLFYIDIISSVHDIIVYAYILLFCFILFFLVYI